MNAKQYYEACWRAESPSPNMDPTTPMREATAQSGHPQLRPFPDQSQGA
jgi:hypothetical protein